MSAPAAAADVVGQLQSPALTETSGIAFSARHDGVIWGINDSGNEPLLHAFTRAGSALGAVRVSGARNRDWEDLASFEANGEKYLLIADTGDNYGRRAVSKLLIIEEPLSRDGRYSGNARVHASLSFRYENGPRDCEAVAVVNGRRALLVSKRDVPAAVYEVPLALESPQEVLQAKLIGTVAALPRPTISDMLESPRLGAWRHQPTGMDISGQWLALVTYQNVYFFQRQPGQSWQTVLAGAARVVSLPGLSQYESIALGADAAAIVVAEGPRAPVIAVSP